jgi:acetyltransferase-like isoleucine patch superfamily enzyme
MLSVIQRIPRYLWAKYRGCTWLSCFETPRIDVLRGISRWRWLASQRRKGILLEPDVRIQGVEISTLDNRLSMGKGVALDRGVTVWIGENSEGSIGIGEGVYVGPYAFLGSSGHRLTIGENTLIGSHSYIITVNHRTARKDIPYVLQGYEGADVTIGKNVWIGCHVTILPGVTIGDNAIIGAGAVVTKTVPAGETWVGVPAQRIKESR